MSQTNMFRPGIDVTQAELISHLTWRRQERTEMVGAWKAKIYDMHHVQVSVRSRRVPGAMTDEELFAAEGERPDELDEDYGDLLTEEEKRQLEIALKSENAEYDDEGGFESDRPGVRNGGYDDDRGMDYPRSENGYDHRPSPDLNGGTTPLGSTPRGGAAGTKEEKRGWFGWGKKKGDGKRMSFSGAPSSQDMTYDFAGTSSEPGRRSSVRKPGKELTRKSADRRPSNFGAEDTLVMRKAKERHSSFTPEEALAFKKARERNSDFSSEDAMIFRKGKAAPRRPAKEAPRKKKPGSGSEPGSESEYKKGLRPVLWLTPDFPLKTDELLPLLDILANKVKAVRRLRELLTTKLPLGTFPVKIAIPVVPTIRLFVTFTKFEELRPTEEFSTPLSSPGHFQESRTIKEGDLPPPSSNSWFSWIRGNQIQGGGGSLEDCLEEDSDPFLIPSDYKWVDMAEKKRRLKEKKDKKAKKSSTKKSSRKDEGLESDTEY
eukprot:TRINITY_DN15740_c0_g1_i1.p1 TRINITY_DN15740_c0_g1~~TRINITY_DN15740_c0_g1_i1.p1  ORF type:complete len:489 (+),score=126.18 TRINITY_DN15740_c0_g1_i1:1-1467(+)